jgi:hypothetical protein
MSADNYNLKRVVSQSLIAHYFLFLLGLSACAIASATLIKSLPSLHIQGEDYDNACLKKELIRLHEDVVRVAENRNPDDAWQITKAWLCGVNDTAAATINRHSPKKILFTSQDVGSEVTKELRESGGGLAAQQQAWGASISSEYLNLIISYQSNEACVASVVLRFNGDRWLIVESGSGCD